ncbi:MAG: FAD binding domain-containing protein, partial [Caldilineaceae bacterium]|nr:FAD binding domain-containing protein [Caldilineaceae bacterium]
MRPFDYNSPATVDDVLTRLAGPNNGRIRPLAGGTDLLTLMKNNLIAPVQLVDVKRLEDLPKGIIADGDGLSLGALTTLSALEQDPLIIEQFPLIAEAAGLAATPQLRNMATVGGNLLQRPRCW